MASTKPLLDNGRVALVLFTDPFQFPPTINAAELLAAAGFSVDIIGLRLPHVPTWETSDRIHVHYLDNVRTGLRLRSQYVAFVAKCVQLARANRYRAIIGYDMMAAFPAYLAAKMSTSSYIYHNHDLVLQGDVSGTFYRALKRVELLTARSARAVVFPQRDRANLFCEEAGLVTDPLIVFNCPRRDWPDFVEDQLPASYLRLRERTDKVVLYQGGLAEHRGLLELVRSMASWEFDGSLCIVGLPLEAGIEHRLRSEAARFQKGDRVLVLPATGHRELAALSRTADVGVGVLNVGAAVGDNPRYINLRYLAGASNKVFEYMASGLPVLAARGGGFDELVEEGRRGVLCDGSDPMSIAAALNRLFNTRGLAAEIGAANRDAFYEMFNYDRQFAKVLRVIDAT